MTRPTRRLLTAAVAGALAVGVSACGTTDALVGLHPAPAESTDAPPLDADGASEVTARLLAEQRAVAAEKGKDGNRARNAVLRGDAKTVADAAAARGAVDDAGDGLSRGVEPTVIAQSQGKEWPRAILATTLDDATSTQYLHVMVSREPQEPFRIEASVPMLGGAQLPSVGPEAGGAPFVDPKEGEGLVMAPTTAFKAYANALRTPQPDDAPANVSTDDAFATALRDAAKRQVKALGKLGTYKQTHRPQMEDAVAFRLADGGVVAFGLMERTDLFEPSDEAQELTVPARYSKLVGTKKVTDRMSLTSLEPVVLVVPVEGDVTAIGASELLTGGKGS